MLQFAIVVISLLTWVQCSFKPIKRYPHYAYWLFHFYNPSPTYSNNHNFAFRVKSSSKMSLVTFQNTHMILVWNISTFYFLAHLPLQQMTPCSYKGKTVIENELSDLSKHWNLIFLLRTPPPRWPKFHIMVQSISEISSPIFQLFDVWYSYWTYQHLHFRVPSPSLPRWLCSH